MSRLTKLAVTILVGAIIVLALMIEDDMEMNIDMPIRERGP